MGSYIYQPGARVTFTEGVDALQRQGRQTVPHGVDITLPFVNARVRALGAAAGMTFEDLEIDIPQFRSYFAAAGYLDEYANYYPGNQHEKALEHYLALTLLRLTADDVFIDLASEHSPVPAIYAKLTGATTYSQDIMYPEGVHGNRIGGDACTMPVPDHFASAAGLTCSLEHFEEDGDARLFHELARVLRPGGAVCVVPFYVNVAHVVQTDPTIGVPANVVFDEGAVLHCAEGWGNRHARFYSPQSFIDRVVTPLGGAFRFDFYYLRNAADVHPSIYARFACVATRRS